jgi:tetratricopeptide (TPR) repeat protein
VLAQLDTGRRMFAEARSGDDALRLQVALADLHNLAGWISFDLGRTDAAQAHFRAALDLAEDAGNHSLAANVHYRLGRVHLHHDRFDDALREFDASGHEAAGSELELAIVDANRAWVHAKRGAAAEAERLLARAHDAFAAADPDRAPDWARFFTAADLTGMTGTVHATLAEAGEVRHVEKAVPALTAAIDGYGEDMARSRAFTMIELAVSTLLAGEVESGVQAGNTAVSHVIPLHSARAVDRMRPLHRAAVARPNDDGARELARRIGALSAN